MSEFTMNQTNIPTTLKELLVYPHQIEDSKLIKLRYFDQAKYEHTKDSKQSALTIDCFQKDANSYILALVNEKKHEIEYLSDDFKDNSNLLNNIKQVFNAWSQYQNYDIDYGKMQIINWDSLLYLI